MALILCCNNISKQLHNRKVETNYLLAHKYHHYIKVCINHPNEKKCNIVKKDIKFFEMYLAKLDKVIDENLMTE